MFFIAILQLCYGNFVIIFLSIFYDSVSSVSVNFILALKRAN